MSSLLKHLRESCVLCHRERHKGEVYVQRADSPAVILCKACFSRIDNVTRNGWQRMLDTGIESFPNLFYKDGPREYCVRCFRERKDEDTYLQMDTKPEIIYCRDCTPGADVSLWAWNFISDKGVEKLIYGNIVKNKILKIIHHSICSEEYDYE